MAKQQTQSSAFSREGEIPKQIAALEQELQRLKRALFHEATPHAPLTLPLEALLLEASSFRLAVLVGEVVEVISMVWVEPLAGAPSAIRGTINFRGQLVPVLDVAAGLGRQRRPLDPERFLAVVQAGIRTIALVVDRILGVQILTEAERAAAADTSTTLPSFVRSLFRRDTGSLMLVDPTRLLASGELDLLGELLAEVPGRPGDAP